MKVLMTSTGRLYKKTVAEEIRGHGHRVMRIVCQTIGQVREAIAVNAPDVVIDDWERRSMHHGKLSKTEFASGSQIAAGWKGVRDANPLLPVIMLTTADSCLDHAEQLSFVPVNFEEYCSDDWPEIFEDAGKRINMNG